MLVAKVPAAAHLLTLFIYLLKLFGPWLLKICFCVAFFGFLAESRALIFARNKFVP